MPHDLMVNKIDAIKFLFYHKEMQNETKFKNQDRERGRERRREKEP